ILFEERVLTASTPNLNTQVREIAVGSNSHTTWFSATKAQSIEIKEFTFE
nr:DNA-binding protein [Acinetobacter baumannii]